MTLQRLLLIAIPVLGALTLVVLLLVRGCHIEPPRYNIVVENHSRDLLRKFYIVDGDSGKDLYMGNLPGQSYTIERNVYHKMDTDEIQLRFRPELGGGDEPTIVEVKGVKDMRETWKGKVIVLRLNSELQVDCEIHDYYEPPPPDDPASLKEYVR